MIGQYVRIVAAPTRMGIVKAARFDGGHVSFLFHQDARFAETFLDIWLPNSDLEEWARPTDEQVAAANKVATNQYVTRLIAPNTSVGTVKAARFDRGHVSFLFQQDSRLGDPVPDVWVPDSDLQECAQLTDVQLAVINNVAKAGS